ncbi:MAG TPA: hypothetical protein EYH34_18675 [Planctomycetes bacterium]|nr:hypothetical protein [Planctomycetota bacterium]
MAGRSVHYYLVKTARLSGWCLFGLVLLYILTGFSLCGRYGVEEWISYRTALALHKVFEWPLIGTFLVHSLVTIYFAMRRWGWIKRRAPTAAVRRRTVIGATNEAHEPHVASS